MEGAEISSELLRLLFMVRSREESLSLVLPTRGVELESRSMYEFLLEPAVLL